MALVIYSNTCLPCSHKQELKIIKQFASDRNIHVIDRRVVLKKEWQEEAHKVSGLELPFLYNQETGRSIPIKNLSLETLEGV